MRLMLVTLEVSHLLMSSLKFFAPSNMPSMVVTAEVTQFAIPWKFFLVLLRNRPLMSVMSPVSMSSRLMLAWISFSSSSRLWGQWGLSRSLI